MTGFFRRIADGMLPYLVVDDEGDRSIQWHYPQPVAFSCSDEWGEDWDFVYTDDPSEIDEWDEVRRMPEYDRWHGYPIPSLVKYLDGWQFACWECHRTVSIYEEEDDDDIDEWCEPYSPVFYNQAVYCCQLCRDRWVDKREKQKQRQNEARAMLESKYPNAIDLKVDGGFEDYAVTASFKFGGRQEARWSSDKPGSLLISQVDLGTWESFKGRTGPANE